MQPIWDAEKAAAAAKANRENMASVWKKILTKSFLLNVFQIYLANATGTPIPADFWVFWSKAIANL